MDTAQGTPSTFDDLVRALHERLDDLTPSQRLLAKLVLSKPEEVALMSISELARQVGVNESTVVRFANALGLRGYPALTDLCRMELRRRAHMEVRYDRLAEISATGESVLDRSGAIDQDNIARTVANVDPDHWAAIVDRVVTAPRIYVYGLRLCFGVAHLLSYELGLIRPGVIQLGRADGTAPDQLRHLGADDLFFAISTAPYTAAIQRALEFAAGRNAYTVAVTDNLASPLAAAADTTLAVSVGGVHIMPSVASLVVLVQALASDAGPRLGDTARTEVATEADLISDFGAYLQDEIRFRPDERPSRRPGRGQP